MGHEWESGMYVGETPWHGLGVSFPKGTNLNIEDAIVAAGLDWEVELREIFTQDKRGAVLGIDDYYATCRKTDNTILGVVGAEYIPLQNKEAFAWFQPFLDEDTATIETAGSLRGGKRVWILAKIRDNALAIKGDDKVQNYILLSNSHDGSLAVRVGFTPIRVVCMNTLTLAHESEASKLLRVKHTSRMIENMEDIREIMNVAQREFVATVKQYEKLAKKGINEEDLQKYVKEVFDIKDATKSKKIIPAVVKLFESGRGSELAGKTYWGAYNAVNEYLNYERGTTRDGRMDSLWFGESYNINKKALNTALANCGVN
jgi:phage/plasmid-like protein (TIGR03299 family)